MKILLMILAILGGLAEGYLKLQNPEMMMVRRMVSEPMVYKARTDLAVVQLPNPIPDLGNSIGVNKQAIDPDFKTTYVRATDCYTDTAHLCFNYQPPGGGSAISSAFSADEHLIAIEDSGARTHVLPFDTVNMKVGTQIWESGGGPFFSRTFINVMWNLVSTQLSKVIFGKAIRTQNVYNYAKGLPKGFVAKWAENSGCNVSETICAAAFSTGIQDTGNEIVAWQKGKGWRTYNTMTGLVTGQWGTIGTVSNSNRFAVHQVKMSFLGDQIIIAPAALSCTICSDTPYVWNLDTLTVTQCLGLCTGHWVPGYTTLVNSSGIGSNGNGQYQQRQFSALTSPTALLKTIPANLAPPYDTHISWANDNVEDTAPFLVSTTDTGFNKTFAFAWMNELLMVDPVLGLVHREGHTFSTGKGPFFAGAQTIAVVSPRGDFVMFCTDWMGAFANGTTPRSDLVIARLW